MSDGKLGVCRVLAGDSRGTGYFLDHDTVITSGHVVQHLGKGHNGVTVTFQGEAVEATVRALDAKADVAVLDLHRPFENAPLAPIGEPAAGGCSLPYLAAESAVHATGVIVNADVRNKYGDPRMTVWAPELANKLVEGGQPHSGAPIVVGGTVVGHVIGAILNPVKSEPGGADTSFGGLLEAVPSTHVVTLLDPSEAKAAAERQPKARAGEEAEPGAAAPAAQGAVPQWVRGSFGGGYTPPEIGRKEFHAFVSYRALERQRKENDGDWTNALIDRLDSIGYKTFCAPHILYGDPSGKPDYPKALGRSRMSLLVFSRRWLAEPTFAEHIEAILERHTADPQTFSVCVVRLDDTPVPSSLAKFPVIEAGRDQVKVGGRTLPSSATVDQIVAALFQPRAIISVLNGREAVQGVRGRLSRLEEILLVAETRMQDIESLVHEVSTGLTRRLGLPPIPEPGDSAASDADSRGQGSDEGGRGQVRPEEEVGSEVPRSVAGPPGADVRMCDSIQTPEYAAERAASEVLKQMARAAKAPKSIRALAMRWLDAGMPGSDVPVDAALLLIDGVAHGAALEVLDKALADARAAQASYRNISRIQRMRGAAFGEAERFDEAIAAFKEVGKNRPFDQWSGGILGSTYKKKWVRLGKRRGSLLRKSFEVYRDAFASTLHYYPGINAATLATLIGKQDQAIEIAQMIRDDLEADDDLYFWAAATLGEAYLLLGEYEKAVEAYASAALNVMDNPQNVAVMRRQIPYILGEQNADESPEVTQAREALDQLFQSGGVAAFVGHTLDLSHEGSGSLVTFRRRYLRRQIHAALAERDVQVGFCSLVSASDILFAECVLERTGQLRAVLMHPPELLRTHISSGEWRDRFDRVLSHPKTQWVDLNDQMARDVVSARIECNERILDDAISFAAGIDEEAAMIVVWDGADPKSPEGLAVRAGRDEGLLTVVIDPNDGLDASETTPASTAAVAGPTEGQDAAAPEASTPTKRDSKKKKKSKAEAKSRGARRKDSPPQAGPFSGDYTDKHLFVIGIDDYEKWRPLANARHDAEGFKEALINDYGFELAGELYDREATGDAIEAVFKSKLVPKAKIDDLVVVFFAGHGHTERLPNNEEIGYLVPAEAQFETNSTGMLAISVLREWTNHLASKHVLYIFDSCFSGAATTGGGGGGKPGYARMVITAGASDQVVTDGGEAFENHSVFTWRLLQGLRSDSGLLMPLFAKDLASYLERNVPQDTLRLPRPIPQTPSAGVLPGHGGATIVLKRTDTTD